MAIKAMTPMITPAEERTASEVASLLQRPFHQDVIRSRQIGGRSVDYVSIDDVIDRLNKAAPEWNWSIQEVRIITMPLRRREGMADVPVAQVIGTLSIPGLGDRQGIGTAPCEGTEDATKAAASDAIKRAAALFGVPISGGK